MIQLLSQSEDMKKLKKAAECVGAEFDTININDGEVWVNEEGYRKVMRFIREYGPI